MSRPFHFIFNPLVATENQGRWVRPANRRRLAHPPYAGTG